MPVPWLRILDALIGVTDLARSRRIRTLAKEGSEEQQALEASARGLGGLEARLAGVVVAALKEAFDRDTRRLELERQQIEAERMRVERALALELLRQAGDREIGRLRLLAAASVATWLGTLFLSARVIGGGLGPRVTLGFGWALLLAAIAASFAGQARIARALEHAAESGSMPRDAISSSAAGAVAPWLVITGLALVGFAVLMS
jgi:hypothetical protein